MVNVCGNYFDDSHQSPYLYDYYNKLGYWRRHGVSPSQLYDWRCRYKAGLLVGATEFSQVVVVADDAEDTADQSSPSLPVPSRMIT